MLRPLHPWLPVIPLLLAAGLARRLPVHFAGGLPQAPGADVLHLVLGDARRELGKALLEQADGYFHGGVRHAECRELAADDAHADDAHHEHEREPRDAVAGFPRAWTWLNQRIHAQEHTHIGDAEFDELLPWVWAACRAAPDNIQAYLVGDYVLLRHTGGAAAGIRLLREGLAANPGNPELAFALGEREYHQNQAPGEAMFWFEFVRTNLPPERVEQDVDARILALRALHYLGKIAAERQDTPRVQACLREAEAIDRNHQVAGALRRLLDACSPVAPGADARRLP